jgi:Protein of unknown function (DUF3667)
MKTVDYVSLKKRKKTKICANCEHEFKEIDNFCPNCGQENHQYNQSFGHLFMEFIEAELHFDNKFWLTAKSLFLHPGEITADFIADKRARYVPPIRLYVFASAVFFLLASWLGGVAHNKNKGEHAADHSTETPKAHAALVREKVKNSIAAAEHTVDKHLSDTSKLDFKLGKDDVNSFLDGVSDGISQDSSLKITIGKEQVSFSPNTSTERLDSIAKTGFSERVGVNFVKMLKSEQDREHFLEHFKHLFAESIFVCMPIAAFILYLLYIRRKRNYYEFLIFSIYFHSFAFILMIFYQIISKIGSYFMESDMFFSLLTLGIGVYFVASLRRVYGQSWLRTIAKAFTFFILYSIVFIFVILGITFYLFATTGASGGH